MKMILEWVLEKTEDVRARLAWVWDKFQMALAFLIPLGLVALALALSGCAPDPRNQADADATRIKAQQDALDQEAARARADADFAQKQQAIEATMAQWTESVNVFVLWTMRVAIVAACIILVGVGVGLGQATYGIGKAIQIYAMKYAEVRADVKARLIPLDQKTRQFPGFYYSGHGIYTLANMNGDSVLKLDTAKKPDRDMVMALSATQRDGIVAYEARMSKHPESFATVEPISVEEVPQGVPDVGRMVINSAASMLRREK